MGDWSKSLSQTPVKVASALTSEEPRLHWPTSTDAAKGSLSTQPLPTALPALGGYCSGSPGRVRVRE